METLLLVLQLDVLIVLLVSSHVIIKPLFHLNSKTLLLTAA